MNSTDQHTESAGVPRRVAALAGLMTGALAVAVGMLLAAISDVVSPIDAVGSEVIDRVPRWVKEFAVRTFGTNDKIALRVGIFVLLAWAATLIGRATTRRWWVGVAGFSIFALVGALAAWHRPGESFGSVVPSIVGAAVGGVVLHRMLHGGRREARANGGKGANGSAPIGWDRRRFLVAGGATLAVAAAAGGGAAVRENQRVSKLRAATKAPLPTLGSGGSAPSIPADATQSPVTPFITPNTDFYRIDTAFSFPRIDVNTWKCDVKGMVSTPFSFTYAELLAMPQVERIVTLCCVSNEVGGEYISNAVWRGVLLKDILDRAGVDPKAEQVYSTSIDGWTCGFPVSVANDGRDAMVAVGMNGSALPLEHGFPARLVVPGLYGYVSATKWLRSIELTTWDDQGYWVPRGWAQLGPVKTQSRIDVPRNGTKVAAGAQKIAGVAWAQHTGVAKVEVRVDNGQWQEARLGADVSDDAWRQWVLDWTAPAGDHTIEVRATDKSGYLQTAELADVAPDGATGHHTITVRVA
jgi:DMSO/TMAO reductase YedYZ molybdopterin-dependent catalytic subunit